MGERPVSIWNMSQNTTFCARCTAHQAQLTLMPNRRSGALAAGGRVTFCNQR